MPVQPAVHHEAAIRPVGRLDGEHAAGRGHPCRHRQGVGTTFAPMSRAIMPGARWRSMSRSTGRSNRRTG